MLQFLSDVELCVKTVKCILFGLFCDKNSGVGWGEKTGGGR